MTDKTQAEIQHENTLETYSAELRERKTSLTRQILLISGSIQTITIGAILSRAPQKLTEHTIELLKFSWLQLSASITLCLILMYLQIFSMVLVENELEYKNSGIKLMQPQLPLKEIGLIVGLLAFIFCISGIYTIACATISYIGN